MPGATDAGRPALTAGTPSRSRALRRTSAAPLLRAAASSGRSEVDQMVLRLRRCPDCTQSAMNGNSPVGDGEHLERWHRGGGGGGGGATLRRSAESQRARDEQSRGARLAGAGWAADEAQPTAECPSDGALLRMQSFAIKCNQVQSSAIKCNQVQSGDGALLRMVIACSSRVAIGGHRVVIGWQSDRNRW